MRLLRIAFAVSILLAGVLAQGAVRADERVKVVASFTILADFVRNVGGDRVDVISDGTNWFAYGFCSVFDAITITTAS